MGMLLRKHNLNLNEKKANKEVEPKVSASEVEPEKVEVTPKKTTKTAKRK